MAEDATDVRNHSALIKGLRVLEVVATQDRLSDIARTTGLSYSTVHRILTDLVSHGWVHQDSERRYHPGPRPTGLTHLLPTKEDHLRDVIPHLLDLRDQTGHTVHFAVRRNERLTYTVKLDGLGSHRMRSYVGMELPLHCTAIGKAILATMHSDDVLDLLSRTRVRQLTERTLTTRRQLFDQLAVTGERGWALDDGENEANTRCIGVAVGAATSQARSGLSLSGLDSELNAGELAAFAPAVVAAGQAVSKTLMSRAD